MLHLNHGNYEIFSLFSFIHFCLVLFINSGQFYLLHHSRAVSTQLVFFSSSYLLFGSPRPIVGHYRGDSLTHSMLISSPFDACDCTRTRQYTHHQFDSCKKQHTPLLFTAFIVWGIGTKKMKERTKTSNLIVDHFSLTFVNFSLT